MAIQLSRVTRWDRGPRSSGLHRVLGPPRRTRDAFRDGWFITGDTAVVENGVYRILGRTNIDILKTGGHKVSALEIEEALRRHPAIAECGVVGIPDAEWGERVAAALVLKEGEALDLQSLRTWAKELLAPTNFLLGCWWSMRFRAMRWEK